MSVKHLEYIKISNSKVLVVEVRPVKCLVDTPSGPTHTDKWMECSHWKELYDLMTDIVEEYEEQKITHGIKYNQPKCKTGAAIQMGYMFRGLPSCWCSLYFLTPRNPFSRTGNDDCDGKLQDKGGRFEDFALCGEMLVVSVTLRDSSASNTTEIASTPSCSGVVQQARLNQKLMKALDSRATYVNSISDYFKASTASTDDSPAKCMPSSSQGKQTSPPLRVKTSTSCNAEHEIKGDECNDRDNSFNSSISVSVQEVSPETKEREMGLLYGYDSEHAISNERKSLPNCVEHTKSNYVGITYKTNNFESNMDPAYQCNDINLYGVYSNSGSFTSESEEMFSNLESPKYQHDPLNDSNVSYSVSVNPCDPLNDYAQLENVRLGPQTYSCIATDSIHEADENSKFHSVVDDSTLLDVVKEENLDRSEDYCESVEIDSWNCQRIPLSNCDIKKQNGRSREVDKADESFLDGNALEMKIEGQKETLPDKLHNCYLPETSTFKRKDHNRNSSSPETECSSTLEDDVIDAEDSIDCVQMSEDSSVSGKSSDYGHERKLFEVEATKSSVFFTTSVKNYHAENELDEDLHCHSDSTERDTGKKMPSSNSAKQAFLSPRGLLTPITDIAASVHVTRESDGTDKSLLSTQNCGSFNFAGSALQFLQTPKHEHQISAQLNSKNIVKKIHSSKKNIRSIKSLKSSEQQTLDKELCEIPDTPETKCKGQIQNVRKKRKVYNLAKTLKVADPEDEDKYMTVSCNSILAVGGENGAREDFLPMVKEELHSDSEIHQSKRKLLHYSSESRTLCQNPHYAIVHSAGEVDEQSSVQKGLENHSIKCPKTEETSEFFEYVEKPEIELDLQNHAPYRADEEYVPSRVTCKWKKEKRKKNMPDLKLEYDPINLRNLTASNYGSCTVEDSVVQEGDFVHNIGAPEAESAGYTDKLDVKLEFQNDAPFRAHNEYIPEKITCNWKGDTSNNMQKNLEPEYVPTNIRLLSLTDHGSCTGEVPRVQEGDLTQVSEGLPLCGEEGGYIPKMEQQHIPVTETCVPSFTCEDRNDAGKSFEEDLDLSLVSTEKYDSLELPGTMETSQEFGPPQRLASHLNEENFNETDYPQKFQDCAQSTESEVDPLKISIFDDQKAAKEKMKNLSLHQSLRAFRNSKHTQAKYEDETCMKRKGFSSMKAYDDTGRIKKRNALKYQEKLEKRPITSNTPASDTAMKSNLRFNKNSIRESILEGNSSDSISSQNASISNFPSPEKVDVFNCRMQSENLEHILDNSSLQSSICAFLTEEKGDSGDREDETESKNLSSNCKKFVQQKTWGDNRKTQLSIGINNPKVRVTEDDATDEKCMSKEVMHPKRKIRSVPRNEKFLAPPKESTEKCVTQAEESDQMQDARMERLFGESSQNCPIKMYKNIRLSEENESELLQYENQKKELGLRRSGRLRKKLSSLFWVLNTSDDDPSEKDFIEKNDIAAETEKSIKFFERYVKERNAGTSSLKQKKISDYVKPCKTFEQEQDCEERLFKSIDNKLRPVSTNKEVSRSVRPKSTKKNASKTLHGKVNTSPELLKHPTSKCETSEEPQFSVEQTAIKCHKKTSNLTVRNGQEEKRVKSNKNSMKEIGKTSVSQERKKVSPKKVAGKKVRKKKTVIDGTSTIQNSERDLESSPPASEKDLLRWLVLAEMEEHDQVVSDEDSVLESSQNSHRGPRTEEESSESWAEEQPQPTEREDDIDVVYFQDLASLKASYRRLERMTESDLEQRMDENLSYLEHVALGRVHNERHEMFISSLQQLKQQQDYLICGPFTADQTEHVLELLKKKLSHLDRLFGSVYDVLTYRCRVLMPTFLTKVVMDNENISLKKAEQLMIKFSLDRSITGTTNTKDWRKF